MKPILIFFSIFFSSQVFAWTIQADFEDGPIGTTAESLTDGFHTAAGHSKYTGTPALSGSNSASVTATEGKTGFGVWGGGFNFPKLLHEGDQIWYRVNVYFPNGWDFSCGGCTEGMKFMRIHTKSSTGANEGYHSSLINDEGNGGLIFLNSEVNPGFNYPRRKGNPVQSDQWHTYEMYIKFSSVASEGIFRFWQDGELISETLNYATMKDSTSVSNNAYLYAWWNNGAPKTQTSYVDDIVITSEIPGRKDAHGNSYIGVGASIYIAPPKAPASVGKN